MPYTTQRLNLPHSPPCRFVPSLLVFFWALNALPSVSAGPQQAPIGPPLPGDGETKVEVQRLAQSLPTDRKTILALESLRESLEEGRWEAAVEELRRLRTSDAETMVPAGNDSATFIPLYRAAFDSWLQLPDPQREQFGERDEEVADRSLARILENGEIGSVPRLILEFLGTTAALRAHLVIAKLHLDRGNTLAAHGWLRPLQHRGVEGKFRDMATNASTGFASDNQSELKTNASLVPPRQPLPRNLLWQYRPSASPQIQQQIDTFVKAAMSSNVVLQSSWADQLKGGLTFRKTLRGVVAISLADGEPVWEYPLTPGLDGSITSNNTNNLLFQRLRADSVPEGVFTSLDQTAIANFFCRNEVLGTVSVDDERIYAVAHDERGPTESTRSRAGFPVTAVSRRTIHGMRLMALEQSTGRRVWTVSSASIEDSFSTDSPNLWIAGPPTVSKGKLLSVAEWNGEVYLICFEPRTGEVKWKQTLAFPEQTIDKDPNRQLRTATPLAESGLIWCPTTTDRIVCIDELTHSVVWAGYLPSNTEKHDTGTLSRGRPLSLTAAAAIVRRWPRSEFVISGDRLLAFSPQSHEVFRFNAITGQTDGAIEVEPSSVVSYVDASMIVIAEPSRIYCLDPTTGNQSWSFDFASEATTPVGRGLLQDGRLLLAMSNGDLLSLNAHDGTLLETSPNILPKGAWGQLLSVGAVSGDVLYAAPERLIRISSAPPLEQPENVVELAAGLAAAAKWSQALELISNIDSSDPNYHEACGIRFNCLLQLAIRSPETYLAKLKKVEATTAQQTQVRFLEVNSLLKSGDAKQAALRLIEVLRLDPVLAAVPAPIADLSVNSEASRGRQIQLTIPLLTWAGDRLSRLLPEVESDADVLQQLSKLPSTALLAVNHSSVRPLLRTAVGSETSAETALHLLQHSVFLAFQAAESVDSEVALLRAMFRESESDITLATTIRTQLLNSTLLEFPDAVTNGLQHAEASVRLQSRQTVDENFRRAMLERTEKWVPQPYRAVPVTRNTSTSSRSAIMLSTAISDDSFLRQFHWTATPGDFGRLVATNGTQRWSVPGTFKVYGNYSNRTDTLYRFGSVIVLRSFSSIAAISVLDRRVIWSRDFQSRSSIHSTESPNETFQEFDSSRHLLPSENHYRSSPVQFIGASHRWLCLKYDGNVEMIDMLLGNVVWSLRLFDENCKVIATDDVLMVKPSQGPVLCLRRATGEVVSLPDAEDLPRRTIRCVGRHLVCWKAGDQRRPHSVEWIDPENNGVIRRVVLKRMTDFRFLDDATLIGLNNERQMVVVDLVSGRVHDCSFQTDEGSAATQSSERNSQVEDASQPPLWDARRIRVGVDGLNFYLMNDAEPSVQLFRQPSGRELMRFQGELRAVDRQTGRVRWTFAGDDAMLASTDQPNLPVLIFVETRIETDNGLNQSSTKNQFRVVNKLTGAELFNQIVPSRFGLRYLSLETPRPGVLDISVYGNQIRLQGEEAVVNRERFRQAP